MDCPVCQHAMVQQDFGGVQVDVCQGGCGGLWFDHAELDKVRTENETAFTDALRAALEGKSASQAPRGSAKCPHCAVVLHQHMYENAPGVRVDECYECGGFLLDAGELQAIRASHMTAADKEAYCNQMLQQVPEYTAAEADLARQRQRGRAVNVLGRYMFEQSPRLW